MPPQTAMAPSETLVPPERGVTGKMALVGKFHDGRHFFRTSWRCNSFRHMEEPGICLLIRLIRFEGLRRRETYFSPTMAFSSSIVLSVNFS